MRSNVQVQTFCPVTPPPAIPQSLYSPLQVQLPPYIIYITTDGLPDTIPRTTCDTFITTHTSLPIAYVRELLQFGAVYLRTGPPHPRQSPRPKRQSLTSADKPLPTGTPIFFRIYAIPKRHIAHTPFTIIARHDAFITVCKPAGLPVAQSVDNSLECLLVLVARHTGLDQLHITTRLDVPTSGVVLLATSAQNASVVNSALVLARKSYLVWTDEKPREGILSHWYNNAASRRRGRLKTPLIAAWTPSPPEEPGNTDANNDACTTTNGPPAKWVAAQLVVTRVVRAGSVWQSHVQLITGRTHQIRMQFAAEGWPLLGDCKYAPATGRLLHPAPSDLELGEDPSCIGLHAESIQVEIAGILHLFRAPVALRGSNGFPGLEISDA